MSCLHQPCRKRKTPLSELLKRTPPLGMLRNSKTTTTTTIQPRQHKLMWLTSGNDSYCARGWVQSKHIWSAGDCTQAESVQLRMTWKSLHGETSAVDEMCLTSEWHKVFSLYFFFLSLLVSNISSAVWHTQSCRINDSRAGWLLHPGDWLASCTVNQSLWE